MQFVSSHQPIEFSIFMRLLDLDEAAGSLVRVELANATVANLPVISPKPEICNGVVVSLGDVVPVRSRRVPLRSIRL